MEEACEKYFGEIENKAVKVLFVMLHITSAKDHVAGNIAHCRELRCFLSEQTNIIQKVTTEIENNYKQ